MGSASALRSSSSTGQLQLQGGSTYPGGNILLGGGSAEDNIVFRTSGSSETSIERARIDSEGVVQIGSGSDVSTPNNVVEIFNGFADEAYATIRGRHSRDNQFNRSEVRFGVEDNGNGLGFIGFATGNNTAAEKFRITSAGLLQTGDPAGNGAGGWKVWLSDSGTTSQRGRMGFQANVNCDETQEVLQIFKNNVEAFRINVAGNVTNKNNSYGALSDAKLKENVVDASSQWEDIKAIQVRNYDLVETGDHHLGVVAQEVEQVSPGLVNDTPDRDEEGNDIGTVTKSVNYSVLYLKAVKALQEAMERIETLEQKVADLES